MAFQMEPTVGYDSSVPVLSAANAAAVSKVVVDPLGRGEGEAKRAEIRNLSSLGPDE
ncbi:uncharacterized protein BO95DRAFT_442206 [Aspergillus brunneoviolaceus CBS 621.78]|uniref:Uncharacterized protein n=1 Tax=Aspergillus brunneoviolaceus CBS 621.78 TaxID=1450534 RepID=A0ACD1GAL3_9EURO|nr:hypothetical protein BO95DRAFT_442206 [Aspergillus brunneoviolaceus CBS 621.78]RAH46316.1 hypothetical protein BO95DRAFT_442206 [Aspergillus brunneoviolaceus CBS 621.78]